MPGNSYRPEDAVFVILTVVTEFEGNSNRWPVPDLTRWPDDSVTVIMTVIANNS